MRAPRFARAIYRLAKLPERLRQAERDREAFREELARSQDAYWQQVQKYNRELRARREPSAELEELGMARRELASRCEELREARATVESFRAELEAARYQAEDDARVRAELREELEEARAEGRQLRDDVAAMAEELTPARELVTKLEAARRRDAQNFEACRRELLDWQGRAQSLVRALEEARRERDALRLSSGGAPGAPVTLDQKGKTVRKRQGRGS